MPSQNRSRRGVSFAAFAMIAGAWLWQLSYAGTAFVVQGLTDPDLCETGWNWPEPLPWSACRGLGLSDASLHLLGLPGDIAMYPFTLWPHVMTAGVAANPVFWLVSAIHVLAISWLLRTLVRRWKLD